MKIHRFFLFLFFFYMTLIRPAVTEISPHKSNTENIDSIISFTHSRSRSELLTFVGFGCGMILQRKKNKKLITAITQKLLTMKTASHRALVAPCLFGSISGLLIFLRVKKNSSIQSSENILKNEFRTISFKMFLTEILLKESHERSKRTEIEQIPSTKKNKQWNEKKIDQYKAFLNTCTSLQILTYCNDIATVLHEQKDQNKKKAVLLFLSALSDSDLKEKLKKEIWRQLEIKKALDKQAKWEEKQKQERSLHKIPEKQKTERKNSFSVFYPKKASLSSSERKKFMGSPLSTDLSMIKKHIPDMNG